MNEKDLLTDFVLASIVSKRIREQLETNGLTLKQLSDKICIPLDRLVQFENASTLPTLPEFIRIANEFRCALDYMAGQTWFSITASLSVMQQQAVDIVMHMTDKQLESFVASSKLDER